LLWLLSLKVKAQPLLRFQVRCRRFHSNINSSGPPIRTKSSLSNIAKAWRLLLLLLLLLFPTWMLMLRLGQALRLLLRRCPSLG
ncbi:MAG: hypothetical protein OSB41_09570, partial [Kiritimatiellae bacterium]|nr:hypothetical protein [Kiritimatiellia bacterium]